MWKTIQKEPEYEMSSEGLIRNKKTKHVKSTRLSRAGYPRVTLYPSGKTYTVHRLFAEQFLENPDNLPYINHKDGVKDNNELSNLEWCTASYNTKHAISIGLIEPIDWKGSKNPSVKLDYGIVYSIKFGTLNLVSNQELACIFKVDLETIRRVKTGEHWSHVVRLVNS